MEGTQAKIKLWTDAITKEKLHGIADEIEETLGSRVTEKENKGLFKMLLYLSHTANKCDKTTILPTGYELWRIGRCICSKLTEILDPNKFFSGIYHLASALLEMRLYKEALEICDYILPGKLLNDSSLEYESMYSKVAYLLHNATLKLIKQSKLTKRKHYEALIIMIRYDLDITKLAYQPNCWRYVLSKILSYSEKIGAIENNSAEYSYEEFTSFMLDYINKQEISLDQQNEKHIYRLILAIITELMIKNINEKRKSSNSHELLRFFDAFRSSLKNHRSYIRCFNLYERLSIALIRPINRVPQRIIGEIDACTCELRRIIMSYGYGDAIRWYSYSIILLLTDLLVYWTKIVKKSVTRNSSYAFIVSTMTYLEEQSNIFDCYEIHACRCSEPKKCNVQYDLYNNVALRLKALAVISSLLIIDKNVNGKSKKNEKKTSNSENIAKDEDDDDEVIDTKDICNIAVAFSQESESRIIAIKEGGCNQWSSLWPVCGGHMYNLGVSCESEYHEKSVELYSLMCVSFVKLEGINGVNGKTLVNLSYPLLSLLHRLTSVHLNNGNYEEATIVCSLEGIISSKLMPEIDDPNELKVYKSWVQIKRKYETARDLTMLECLRLNREEVGKVIDIQFEDYDLMKVCLREIRALAAAPRIDLSSSIIAILDEMERLGASVENYLQGIQWLNYHILNFQSTVAIDRYLVKAMIKYESVKLPSKSIKCAYGHIKFYEMCQLLRDNAEKIKDEIESAKSANTRSTSPTDGESLTSTNDSHNIVPTYSMIKITVTEKIQSSMAQVLRVWKDIFTHDKKYKEQLKNWEILQVLDVTKILAEYARFYHLENIEVEAWEFAYNLARELNDHHSIIYITMRSLTSRCIDLNWIEEANESIKILGKSKDSEINSTIIGYRLSLADLQFKNGNIESARELYVAATAEKNDNFMSDWTNFCLIANLKMTSIEDDNEDQLQYTCIIVKILYTLLSIDDALETPALNSKLKQLYYYNFLFDFTYNITHRMNSLLSWREITAHLMRRLATAQKLGAALQVAECLKCLCYIDLTRAKSDDCEFKLQGLEHILGIEGFDITMKSELVIPNSSDRISTSSPSRVVEAVRDVGQNNTSPVLRVKKFSNPEFIMHSKGCACFKCTNSRYQNLVFAATHLRAELFSLRRNSRAAFQHFEGAAKIKKNIISRGLFTIRTGKNQRKNDDKKNLAISRSYRHLEIVEYVYFHLDYCRFLKWYMPSCINEGFEVALEALALCQKYNLKKHPVSAATKQLLFEYRYEVAYNNAQFSKFTVPSLDKSDTNSDIRKPVDHQVCVTPSRDIIAPKAIPVRRRKNPPFLNLEKVPIDLTEEKPSISPSTPPRPRRTRRPRIITDTQQDPTVSIVPSERKKVAAPKISFTISIDDDDDEKPAKIDIPATPKQTETGHVEEIQSKLITMDPQSENRKKATARSRKVSQRGSATSRLNKNVSSTSTDAQISDIPAAIDDVTELLNDLTVTKTRPCLSLNAEKSISMSSDDASFSGNEVAVVTKRTSSRLKKKSQEISSIDNRKTPRNLDECASNSEDEVLIIGSNRRRLVSTSIDKSTTAKESVKSSRSGRILRKTTGFRESEGNL